MVAEDPSRAVGEAPASYLQCSRAARETPEAAAVVSRAAADAGNWERSEATGVDLAALGHSSTPPAAMGSR